jgi:cullin-4
MLTTVSKTSHTNRFVNPFLHSSKIYYQAEGQRLLGESLESVTTAEITTDSASTQINGQQMPIWDYLSHVKKRLSEEAVRCDTVMGQDVKGGILRVIEETLVGQHVMVIVQRGLPPMFEGGRVGDLAVMYGLLARVSALPTLKNEFGEYLKVSRLLCLKAKSKALARLTIASRARAKRSSQTPPETTRWWIASSNSNLWLT